MAQFSITVNAVTPSDSYCRTALGDQCDRTGSERHLSDDYHTQSADTSDGFETVSYNFLFSTVKIQTSRISYIMCLKGEKHHDR